MDTADLELFRHSLRTVLERRSVDELEDALVEVGWCDALAADRRDAVSVLFGLQGGANASTAALERVVVHGLGMDAEAVTGAVLPAVGRCRAPGTRCDGRTTVHGVAMRRRDGSASVVVVSRDGDGDVAGTVPCDSLTWTPIRGIDPDLGLVDVSGDVQLGDVVAVEWDDAVALAQRAIAYELVGASRRMLELAREHALTRVQFDRPIASFQAVRHRLAETLVAIEAADAALEASWLDPSQGTAALAKAVAGRSARTAARHCQQVLAGIGFTTEHELHRHIRRVLILEQLFGGTRELTRALGEEALGRRRLPTVLPL